LDIGGKAKNGANLGIADLSNYLVPKNLCVRGEGIKASIRCCTQHDAPVSAECFICHASTPVPCPDAEQTFSLQVTIPSEGMTPGEVNDFVSWLRVESVVRGSRPTPEAAWRLSQSNSNRKNFFGPGTMGMFVDITLPVPEKDAPSFCQLAAGRFVADWIW
jgi:hypothetical protein